MEEESPLLSLLFLADYRDGFKVVTRKYNEIVNENAKPAEQTGAGGGGMMSSGGDDFDMVKAYKYYYSLYYCSLAYQQTKLFFGFSSFLSGV